VNGGSLTTRPLEFEGKNLFLNSAGPVEIEVLTVSGEALGKASVDGDLLCHRINLGGRSLSDVAPQGYVCLHSTVGAGGKLHSFTIDPATAVGGQYSCSPHVWNPFRLG